MKIFFRVWILLLKVTTICCFMSVVVSALSGSFIAFEKYGRIAGQVLVVSFLMIFCMAISLVLFKSKLKEKYDLDVKVYPVNKDEWRSLRKNIDTVIIGFIILIASVVLFKVYVFSYGIHLKKGYYLKGNDACVNLYTPKDYKLITDVYGYKEINDLVVGYAGPWELSSGDPGGYFVINTSTGSTSKGLEKEDYLKSLQANGINNEPKLIESRNERQ